MQNKQIKIETELTDCCNLLSVAKELISSVYESGDVMNLTKVLSLINVAESSLLENIDEIICERLEKTA